MNNSRVYEHRPLGSHSSHATPGSGGLPPIPPPASLLLASSSSSSANQNNSNLGGGGGGGGGLGPHPSAARLNDLLEFVKAEFEQVSGESGLLRAQREEYEAMINHHANELNAMRAMSYDLERKHLEEKRSLQEDLARLQEDNTRLRTSLSASSSTRPSLPSLSNPRPPSAGGPPIVGHGPSNLFGGGMLLPANGERAGEREYGYAGNGREREEKRGREEEYPGSSAELKGKGPAFSKPGGTPGPHTSSALTSRPPSTTPLHHPSPIPPVQLPPIATSSTPVRLEVASPEQSKNEQFDPETVAKDLKKEGSDWMTMFNPNVKRVLDVGLVHTLVHDSVVCCVKFSPDGKVLATGCNRNTTLYDTKTGAKISVLFDESSGVKADNYIRSASFSPDGKLLATGSEDRIVRIWNIAQKRISKVFQGHKSEIYSLAFSPDGRRLVSGSGDKTARMWDMETGACLFTLTIEDITIAENGPVDAGVTSVVMSPDGRFLAAGSLDTVVRIWDAQNGQLLDKLKGHKDSVYSVAFSPDGNFLVSGSLDKTLKMWDMASLEACLKSGNKEPVGEGGKTFCMTTLQGHKDYVLSVDISPDGAWIVSGSKDRGVQFWDPKSAKAQLMLQGHKNSVISVAVSNVGGLVATGSGDWSARIWRYERIDA